MRTSPDDALRVDEEARRGGAALVVELGADLRQAARLVDPAHRSASRKRIRRKVLIASIMAGSGNDKELRNWQTLAQACQEARRRWPRAQLLVSAHGPKGHGLEHRQGRRALLRRDRGREGGREDSRVERSSRRRRRTSSSKRRRASAAARTRSYRRTRSRRCRSSIRRRSSSRSTSTDSCRAADLAGRRFCRCRSRTWRR